MNVCINAVSSLVTDYDVNILEIKVFSFHFRVKFVQGQILFTSQVHLVTSHNPQALPRWSTYGAATMSSTPLHMLLLEWAWPNTLFLQMM